MRQEIKYIGFYDLPESKQKRVANLAATNKMDYIGDAIIRAGFKVHFVSPSWFEDSASNASFRFQNTINLNEWKRITFCPSFGTKAKWLRNIKIIFSLLWLFFWLILHTKRDEKVLMYHVPWLSIPVRWAKKIRGFKLILEIEEIYGDVSVIHPYFYVLEKKLIKCADAYLLSTDLLSSKIDSHKPFIVIYGAYKTYPQLETPPDDGKIHLLYAGIIDTHKAGAFNAVEAARYLPQKYILHIIGFGDVNLLKEKIAEVNALKGCNILYDGILSGDEYVKYCQKCHIGLSTQNMDGEYLESSFPSKILSYMGMGLQVVSGRIESVIQSDISKYITLYSKDHPKFIAKSILSIVKCKSGISRAFINSLNDKFTSDINKMINQFIEE